MLQSLLLGGTALALLGALAAIVLTLRTVRWGATDEECDATMPGDAYLATDGRARVAMTRAVSIDAPPDSVWPWLAQMGRGAGWYSYDALDNGRKRSAEHIVSWIPTPEVGDASPIGVIRHLVPGAEITWWVEGVRFVGSTASLAFDVRLTAREAGSRLVVRITAEAKGGAARPALAAFRPMDGLMARRQLVGIRERVEQYGARTSNPDRPETGDRDQYQNHQVIYRSGERAGTPGKDLAQRWRDAAIERGCVDL